MAKTETKADEALKDEAIASAEMAESGEAGESKALNNDENATDPSAENETEAEAKAESEPEATTKVKDTLAKAKTETKAEEAKVFYVEGYGNVNGCKNQAEAEKKAEKLKKQIRE